MKKCPRCDRTFPDSETFCEADGTALVKAGPAFSESARGPAPGSSAGEQSECPVCGGKAQPGELICNFCGARLGVESPANQYAAPSPAASPPKTTKVARDPSSSMRFTGKMPDSQEEEKTGRSMLGVAGYILAAIVALSGGAWLALNLSNKNAEQPVASASPAAPAAPAASMPTVPTVDLAKAVTIQVTGDSASAPERNQEVVRKYFEDHKAPLVESYSRALAGDATIRDAMVLRVRILPSGSVDAASVRTSTNANPSLDAEVVKDVSAWNFPAFSGGPVEVDYPIVFTNDPAAKDSLESQLNSKLANLGPTEAPEFASTPPSPAASEAASSPSPAPGAETPVAGATEAAPVAEALPPPPAPRKHRPHRPPATPTLTLQQLVKQELASNRKLRRVDCYTSGNTVTIFGKVFDYQDKQLAERVVRGVPGVGNVVNSLATDEADWAARQDRIAQQLANAGLNQVTVKVIDHDAYLGGTVKTDAQKNQAVTIAQTAAPVNVRTNLITVVPGNMFGF